LRRLLLAHLASAAAIPSPTKLGIEPRQDRSKEGVTDKVNQRLTGAHLRTAAATEAALDSRLRGNFPARGPVFQDLGHPPTIFS
jgi:hypothetical protein